VTGTWGSGEFTKGSGPAKKGAGGAQHEHPLSSHPLFYSISVDDDGALTIVSGENRAWTVITFSGAHVLDAQVKTSSGKALAGMWSEDDQKWTPADSDATV
jgi:hypothetical protein